MGAPGSYYWTGTIKVYNLTSDSFYSPNKEDVDSHRYSYLGENLLTRTAVLSVRQTCREPWLIIVCVARLCRDCRTFLLSWCHRYSCRGTSAQRQWKSRDSVLLLVSDCPVDVLLRCSSDLFFSCTGLHFQNRRHLVGEELPCLRENGMSSAFYFFLFLMSALSVKTKCVQCSSKRKSGFL